MENPIKIGDLGVPLFLETPKYSCVALHFLLRRKMRVPDALSGTPDRKTNTNDSEQDIGSEEVPRQESTHGFIPTRNAKRPIFEGNFTPKTSNYCIKNLFNYFFLN